MPALHLQDCWPLIAQGVECLDQSWWHQLLFAIKLFADVLELVDWVKLHGCHVRWIKDVSEDFCEASFFLEFNECGVPFKLFTLFPILLLLLGLALLFFISQEYVAVLLLIIIVIRIVVLGPREEQMVKLLHHLAVGLCFHVDMHGFFVDQLVE